MAGLRRRLPGLAASLEAESDRVTHAQDAGMTFNFKRTRDVQSEVQQAIEPEVIALTVFGAITAVAALVLTSLAMGQLLSRTAPDAVKLRALGARRGQAALVAALPGVLPVAGIIVITVAGAVALSPLAPVGPVRFFAPGKGLHADPLVLGAGLPALLVLFSGLLMVRALRAVRPAGPGRAPKGPLSRARPWPPGCRPPRSWASGTRSVAASPPGPCGRSARWAHRSWRSPRWWPP